MACDGADDCPGVPRSNLGALRPATTRNQFAHRVENLAKSLEAYADGLTAAQKVDVSNRPLMPGGNRHSKESEDFGWLSKGFRRILLESVILPLAALSTKDAEAEV